MHVYLFYTNRVYKLNSRIIFCQTLTSFFNDKG